MIHPFAHFSAAPTPGETLWERAALLERPAAEFAEFLKASGGVRATPSPSDVDPLPQRAASSAAEAPGDSGSPARTRQSPSEVLDPTTPAVVPARDLADETAPSAQDTADAADPAPPGPPRFADVPDSAKFPAGPYRQAPAGFGGEWWLVSPFTGAEPWLNQEMAAPSAINAASRYATENLPDDFLQAFGEMPSRRTGENGDAFVARLARWKQDLEFFQRIGSPDGADEAQIELASAAYEQWGMGRPVFYEGRYGWLARFPDSVIPEFEMDAASAVEAPHLAIARFQVRLLQQGQDLPAAHPFVPPHLLPESA